LLTQSSPEQSPAQKKTNNLHFEPNKCSHRLVRESKLSLKTIARLRFSEEACTDGANDPFHGLKVSALQIPPC